MLDGYLDNCVIYADTDGDAALLASTPATAAEPSNTSTFNGGWSLILRSPAITSATLRVVPAAPASYDTNRFANGPLDECHDATSMLKLYVALAAPPMSTVVSPLTTLLVAMQERGYTEAERKVKAAFGINATAYTLGQTDPIKALYVDMDKGAEPFMRAEQQVMTAVMQTSAYLIRSTADLPAMARIVWAALAQAVEDVSAYRGGNSTGAANTTAGLNATMANLASTAGGGRHRLAEITTEAAMTAAARVLQDGTAASSDGAATPTAAPAPALKASVPLDLTAAPTLATLLENALALLGRGAADGSGGITGGYASNGGIGAGPGSLPTPNTAGVVDLARRDAALAGMSNTQQIIEAVVGSGNLTQVAAASRVAQENVTQQLRQLATPGGNPNVAAFMAATSTDTLARAVAVATTAVNFNPTIPSSISGNDDPDSGGSSRGLPGSWVASNMAGFVILVVLVPLVLLVACGTGYFVMRRRHKASEYKVRITGSPMATPAPSAGGAPPPRTPTSEAGGCGVSGGGALPSARSGYQSAGGASALSAVTSLSRRISGASTADVQFLPCPPTAVNAAAGAINLSRMRTNFNALFEREALPAVGGGALLPGGSLALATCSHGPPMSREAGTIVASAPQPSPGVQEAGAPSDQVITHYANVLFDAVHTPRSQGTGTSDTRTGNATGDDGGRSSVNGPIATAAAAGAGPSSTGGGSAPEGRALSFAGAIPRGPGGGGSASSSVTAAPQSAKAKSGAAAASSCDSSTARKLPAGSHASDFSWPVIDAVAADRVNVGSRSPSGRSVSAGPRVTRAGSGAVAALVAAAEAAAAVAAAELALAASPAGRSSPAAGRSPGGRRIVRSCSMGRAMLESNSPAGSPTAAIATTADGAMQVESSRDSAVSLSGGGPGRLPRPMPATSTFVAPEASFSMTIPVRRNTGPGLSLRGLPLAPTAAAAASRSNAPSRSPDPEAGGLPPFGPGIGGGGFLSLATASGRLPGYGPLESSPVDQP
ncbi:hypothetical protein GPECTOR_12g593 [Gonium pectorale]|uniref:Uncharacterized protein n=1 Tax=Gonium pectorale TaxID=33097 RepID=A0A150GP64_GONPE|nr:hypothetical protein GPECTOR_12g593 [Gonium pectorale]|eukprot:KXZ51629.1 hypothetical protein GPECTOR_12g593 [Gonium pectorale]